jgi:SAM-dependent methyltransferase
VNASWTWDETLFAGAARDYDRGRLPYPPRLPDVMRAALHLDGTGRLLDVGCGPGSILLRVADLFAEAVGLDADPGMIAEATRLAGERGVTRATFVRGRAEELPAGLGSFRVVTFGASFHWMDRPKVASIIGSMLDPGGILIHVDTGRTAVVTGLTGLTGLVVPYDEITRLIRTYLGPLPRAGQSIRTSSPDDEDDVFRGAGFVGPACVPVPDGRILTRTIDDVVAGTFSRSASAPHLFGDRMAEFETELRDLLAGASPSGTFTARVPDTELRIWRPAAS